jgi:hypothetical protein
MRVIVIPSHGCYNSKNSSHQPREGNRFLLSVERDRGSGVFEFLTQFDPLMTWVVALGAAATWYRSSLAADQELDEKRLVFIRTNFPNASTSDVQAYTKAWTTFGRRRVLQRLIGQHLGRAEVSKSPHSLPEAPSMVDMKVVVALEQHGRHA